MSYVKDIGNGFWEEENNMIDKNSLIVDKDVTNMITNKFIAKMMPIDWGKTMAIANEYIGRDLITALTGEKVIHTEECVDGSEGGMLLEKMNIDTSNNGSGFDTIVLSNGKTIQCKIRQVKGKTPYSHATHFDNTRRTTGLNNGVEGGGESGHVRYSSDEFDYVLVSLVKCYEDKSVRTDLNKWNFAFIPISDLVDTNLPGFCLPSIPAKVLEKNKIETDDDWKNKVGKLIVEK
jgi:hypothetical protein